MANDFGLLVLRLVVGGLLFGHGAQKLFGWFGGPGFAATQGHIANGWRLRPAPLWTFLAGLSETGGGLLLAVGLLSPLGPLGIIASMFMAIRLGHWGKLWASKGGMEYPLTLLAGALALGFTGPGRYSLDAALHLGTTDPLVLLAGIALVVVGSLVALATRAPVAQQPVAEHAR